jgi:hypothetical protein
MIHSDHYSEDICSNGRCSKEFERLRRYIAALEASVTKHQSHTYFLQDGGLHTIPKRSDGGLNALPDDSDTQGDDTDIETSV